MLQWFKYSANSNGSTLYTEKSQTFKNDWNPLLSFVFHNDLVFPTAWKKGKVLTRKGALLMREIHPKKGTFVRTDFSNVS